MEVSQRMLTSELSVLLWSHTSFDLTNSSPHIKPNFWKRPGLTMNSVEYTSDSKRLQDAYNVLFQKN